MIQLFWSVALLGAMFFSVGSAQAESDATKALQAELTQFRRTGPYAEVEAACHGFAKKFPDAVRCFSFGQTSEGRDMLALAVSHSGVLNPEQARRAGVPVVLAIGGTHSGEIDGKDAGLILIRDLLAKTPQNDPLKNQIFLFVPVFNIDGHERTSPYNRPNQNGPSLQGERVTAKRINLNRDWILGQSEEMNAMLHLISQWDPLLTLHLPASNDFLSDMMSRLQAKGHQPLDFTPVLLDFENPRAGIMRDADAPRFSHVYAALRNRIGLLVEDHAWDPYAKRVQTSKDVLAAALDLVSKQGQHLRKLALEADHNSAQMQHKVVALDWHNVLEDGIEIPSGQINLLGYAYTTHNDAPVVGGRHISYHLNKPEVWRVPVYSDIQPVNDSIVSLPQTGYIIPAGWVSVVLPYLQKHNVSYQRLTYPLKNIAVQELVVDPESIAFDTRTFQGRIRTDVKGQWTSRITSLPQNSIFVPIHQERSLLAVHLLEPASPDSLSRWGLFNTAYEVTDHISNHRQLQIAQWMYGQDRRIRERYGEELHNKLTYLRKEYQTRMDRDDRFLADPEQRMDFWIREIPYHDPTFNKYPIVRINQPVAPSQ